MHLQVFNWNPRWRPCDRWLNEIEVIKLRREKKFSVKTVNLSYLRRKLEKNVNIGNCRLSLSMHLKFMALDDEIVTNDNGLHFFLLFCLAFGAIVSPLSVDDLCTIWMLRLLRFKIATTINWNIKYFWLEKNSVAEKVIRMTTKRSRIAIKRQTE